MKLKRLVASLLSVCMVAAATSTTLISTAFAVNAAASQTGAELVVSSNFANSGIALDGKQFDAYQVFSAVLIDYDANANEEQGIEYAVAPAYTKFFVEVAKLDASADSFNQEALDYINGFKNAEQNIDNMQTLVALLRTYTLAEGLTPAASTTATVTEVNGENRVSTEDANLLGYYLVLDSAADVNGTAQVATAGALVTIPSRDGLALSGNTTINIKGSAPKLEKEVYHNDTNKWEYISDYQIGDTIEYRIIAGMPDSVVGYDKVVYDDIESAKFDYIYTITDTPADGIDLDRSNIHIYADEGKLKEVEGNYHYITRNDDGGFTIVFDMVAIKGLFPDLKQFYVYYTGELTKDANITVDSEENTARLDFSNNPYVDGSIGSVGNTVYTYTFDLDVLKTSGDGETPLKGAIFALYKTHVDGLDDNDKQIYLEDLGGGRFAVNPDLVATDDVTSAAGTKGTIETLDDGAFTIIGLDDAIPYKLVEIKAPTGYNAADPIFFTINATYKPESGKIVLDKLTTTNEGAIGQTNNDLQTTIINTSSTLLPTTGGVGTTLFTYGGIALMACAVLVFVVKRKKS